MSTQEKITDGRPLKITTDGKLFEVAPGLRNRYKTAFKANNGEITVHCSNFTKEKKFFKILVEEVDAQGNSLVPAAAEKKNYNSLSVAALTEELTNRTIEIPAGAKKPDLVLLLEYDDAVKAEVKTDTDQ